MKVKKKKSQSSLFKQQIMEQLRTERYNGAEDWTVVLPWAPRCSCCPWRWAWGPGRGGPLHRSGPTDPWSSHPRQTPPWWPRAAAEPVWPERAWCTGWMCGSHHTRSSRGEKQSGNTERLTKLYAEPAGTHMGSFRVHSGNTQTLK